MVQRPARLFLSRMADRMLTVLRRSPTGQPHDVAAIAGTHRLRRQTDRQTQPPRSATKAPLETPSGGGSAFLFYIGRPGVAPFSSMIVQWNPQTVKRRRGQSLDVALDTGACIGGVYKAG